MTAAAAAETPKDASASVIAQQTAMLNALPFSDTADFDDAARGLLAQERLLLVGVSQLVRGEETSIGHAGAAVLQLDQAADFGLQSFAEIVEEIGERAVAGSLLGRRTAGADVAQFGEVGFDGIRHVDGVIRNLGSDERGFPAPGAG